jgi:hypothetical protein
MYKAEELKKEIDSCRSRLLTAYTQGKERARIGRENEERAKQINEELTAYINTRATLKECINYVVRIYKNIESYASERKELSMDMLKTAISKAGLIVPDADVSGIELKVGDKSAKIVNATGQDINLREGSAYRTVMGMLIRYTLVKAQPDAIQAILLDEAFNTLSDTTTSELRSFIEIFKEDLLIVGIEQHDMLFQGLDPVVFNVKKNAEHVTTVSKEN